MSRLTDEQLRLLDNPELCGEFADIARSLNILIGPDAWDEDLLEQRLIPITHQTPRLLELAVNAGIIGPGTGRAG